MPGRENEQLGLTGAQQGIWLAQALTPGSPIFNTADAIELNGPVDPEVLAAHIRTVFDDAEALHARFEDTPAGPRQLLPPDRNWLLDLVDFGGAPDPAAAAESYMAGDLAEPIDLACDPLFHTALLRLGPDRWTWYLRIHHIATDAYSTALLVRRVAERMAGQETRPFVRLAELLDADLAYRHGPKYGADRAFWAQRLSGHTAPATLAGAARSGRTPKAALPTAEPERGASELGATPTPSARAGIRAAATIDAATGTALVRNAGGIDASWPELVAAAVAANIQSLTGSERQVMAMPVLARKGVALRAPGACVNVLPLISTVDPAAPLGELVGQIRDELRATRAHQLLRFEELQRMVPTGVPLFGVELNLKPYASELRIGAATARIRNLATGPVNDLSLIVTSQHGGALSLTLAGNPALYDQASVESQLDRLVGTFRAAAAGGALGRPVGALATITKAEHQQVVGGFNTTAHPVARTTLTALLLAQLAVTPDALAVSDEDEAITYRELHARAGALADELRRLGAGPDVIVGLALPRSVGLSVAILAVLLAGAAYLPLDPELPAERLAYVLDDAMPACLVATEGTQGRPDHRVPVLLIDDRGTCTNPRSESHIDAVAVQPEHAAYVLYTSGSTGRPKGVVTAHAAIVNRLAWMQGALPIGPGDAVLQKTPYGFDVSVWELVWPLLHGARLVMARPGGHRDPNYLAELIQREQITTLHFVPSMLELFLEEPSASGCVSLRQVVCSGEALPELTVQRYHELFSAPLHNLYGPTEAAIDVTWWPCLPDAEPGPVPIGRPIWNTRTYVLDAARRPLPVGVPGELWLAGANLARGYLGRPELTAERFQPDPFQDSGARMYRTGDLARWRPDGALEYLGRTDDQVKLRGLRIELGEIEATLARHPSVARAAATVDRSGGAPRLVAFVVPLMGAAPLDVAELVRQAAAALPDYMVPAAVGILEELPLSPNGKLDRRRLPVTTTTAAAVAAGNAWATAGAATAGTPTGQHGAAPGNRTTRGPATPSEQQLCELFAEALGVASISPEQNLFQLGGDSLLAARLAARIRARLGIDLSLGTMFAAPSPAALATRIDGGGDLSAMESVLPLRAQGDEAPLFCIHPAGGIGWCYAGLARTIQDRPIIALQAPTLSGKELGSTLNELARQYADLIEAAAPSGPAHLLGWSVGGVLAHATAATLQARGRATGLVALLDAYPGEQWAEQAPPTAAETLLALLHMGGLSEAALGGAPPALELVLGALARQGSALGSLGSEPLAIVADTVQTTSRMMRQHHTDTINGDLLFVRAAAPRRETWLDATQWQAHITGALVVHDLDCTHPELPRPGPLDAVGLLVSAALAQSAAAVRLAEAVERRRDWLGSRIPPFWVTRTAVGVRATADSNGVS